MHRDRRRTLSDNAPKTLTVEQICRDYQISRQTVKRLYVAGRIPKPYRFGRLLRFPREDTERAFERMRGVAV